MANADDFVDIAQVLDEMEGIDLAAADRSKTQDPVSSSPTKPDTKKAAQMEKDDTINGAKDAVTSGHPGFTLKQDFVLKMQMEFPDKFVAEKLGGYQFRTKYTLLRALLHRTYKQKQRPHNKTFCDPLDYIGDYVLKFIISQYLLEHCVNKSKENLAHRRSKVECQEVYAFLAVRNGFQDYVFIDDRKEWEHLHEYVKAVKDVKTLEQLTGVEKRKCFIHNFFQSVAGAVYVDSGYDLKTVERVYLPMLKPFLDEAVSMDLDD